MAADKKLKVGFVTTVSGRWPRELPNRRHKEFSAWLSENVRGIEVVASDGIAVDMQDVDATVELFRRESVNLAVVMIGAFTGDMVATRIAEQTGVPVVLWALPEPKFDGGRIMSNALVAATMNQAALKRLGLKSHFVYGGLEDERVVKQIKNLLSCYRTITRLRNTFLGVIGYRPTGFYSSSFDETLIRKTFGVTMEAFDLVHISNQAETIDDALIDEDMEAFRKSIKADAALPEDYWRNHSKLYLAIKKVVADNSFDALTIRCWPEMGTMKCTPCAVLSRCADEGFTIACESDVDAAISMLIEQYLTEQIVFMCDLINIDELHNTALFWHCGQAARKLHDHSGNTLAADHSLAGQGVVVEGTLKTGRVTVSRMTQIGDTYKLFLASGTAVPTEKVVKGAMTKVEMDRPVVDMIYRIAEEGIPHHYSIVWEDVYDQMKMLAGCLGIEIIEA